MEVLSNGNGTDAPVRDAPDGAWVIEQDLHHLPSPPDTKILIIISFQVFDLFYSNTFGWQKSFSY